MPPGPGPAVDKKAPIAGVKNLVAVASGKGGVGKTTVAVNLAIALKTLGATVGLLDADVYGPNVPVMLGTSEQPRAVDEKTIIPVEAYGVKMISMGLLNPGDKPLVWRGPMLHSVMQQFLRSVQWGTLDYLIVDLPPGTGDVQLSLIQSVSVTGAVVVTTPSIVALADVRKAVEMFRQVNVEILGVVENMSYFNCPHCNGRIDVFGHGEGQHMAKNFGVPFLGEIEIADSHRRRYRQAGGVAGRRRAGQQERFCGDAQCDRAAGSRQCLGWRTCSADIVSRELGAAPRGVTKTYLAC
jgi:ATP-binding protein involved in chromosome partitioning